MPLHVHYPSTHLAIAGGGWATPAGAYSASDGDAAAVAAVDFDVDPDQQIVGEFGDFNVAPGLNANPFYIVVRYRSTVAPGVDLWVQDFVNGIGQPPAANLGPPPTANAWHTVTYLRGTRGAHWLTNAAFKLRVWAKRGAGWVPGSGPQTLELEFARIQFSVDAQGGGTSPSTTGGTRMVKQTFRKLGLKFGFVLDPQMVSGLPVDQPYRELGTIEQQAATLDHGREVIYDPWNGRNVPITEVSNKNEVSWVLTTPNLDLSNLALMHQSVPPQPFTQAATAATDVMHKFWPEEYVRIVSRDVNGVLTGYPFGINVITSVKIGAVVGTAVTAVRGVDYDYNAEDLELGRIRVLSTSTLITAANTNGFITYTPKAITGDLLITPGSGSCAVQGYGEIFMGECAGQKKMVEQGRYAISWDTPDISPEKLSRIKPRVTRLYDPTGLYPNGRIVAFNQ